MLLRKLIKKQLLIQIVVIRMAIGVINKIKEDDACAILLKEKQELHIVNVDEIKQSKTKKNSFYFFIDFEMKDGTKFGASYSCYLEDGKFKCGTSSKLYHLMKGFLNLNPLTCVALTFDKSDIDEVLQNKKFIASSSVQSIGGKNYPYITCEKVIENE